MSFYNLQYSTNEIIQSGILVCEFSGHDSGQVYRVSYFRNDMTLTVTLDNQILYGILFTFKLILTWVLWNKGIP